MFDNFLAEGSPLAFFLMLYGLAVMFVAVRITNDPLDTPPALRHPIAMLIMMGSMPTAVWPAVYVGLFDGWFAGIVAFFILQFGAGLLRIVARVDSFYFGYHFIAGTAAVFIGYVLSVWSLSG